MSKRKPKKPSPLDVRLSQHPRARRQIRQAKGWGALAACALAGYMSWHSGAPVVDTALRALLWGVVGYVAVWAFAQQVWRHLALAELRVAEKVALERVRAAEAVAREADAAAEPQAPGGR